jgi:DNA repair photolyase
MNPYQGCEHGCVYCYARNSHEYWGYSAGKDFERNILVKKNAPELLRQQFRKKSWTPALIMLSGNTDCYQPAERHFAITRALLKICLEHKNPVGIITKNDLVLRDLDLLRTLNEHNLLRITLSITTLDETLRRHMEPRTSTISKRLQALKTLSGAGIKVSVNMAPIIPGLNSHEIHQLIKCVGQYGAHTAHYIMLRLNGQLHDIFRNWMKETYPERINKIEGLLRDVHNQKTNDSRWQLRMSGDGPYAELISSTFRQACKAYLPMTPLPPLNTEIFEHYPSGQLKIF